jgi:hypothetical protein
MSIKSYYRLVVLGLVGLALTATAWAKVYTMQASSITPGAVGKVDAKADKSGGNVQVTVRAEHLARPGLLTPSATSYVVWVQPDGAQPMNEGTLAVGDNEKGELKLTTSANKFSVFVTAENDQAPKDPSDRIILRSNVQE